MSTIDSTSQATAVGVGAKNEPFEISGENLASKIGVIATYDPLKTSVVDEVPIRIYSAADAGNRFGFGYPLHRLIEKVFNGSNGAGEVWAIPQAETGVVSDGEILWGGAVTAAGTIYLRIANILYEIPIAATDTIENVSDAVVAKVNADPDTPVVAAKTAVTFETTFTSKAKGLEQNNISISLSREVTEELPAGLTGTITAMANGTGTPLIADALDGLGTGDDANLIFLTHVVHGYGIDTTTIDAVSAYVGLGNDYVGLYSKLVSRPFYCVSADADPGSAALTALIAITDARLEDRANMVLGVPDAPDFPSEIAAYTAGLLAATEQNNPANFVAEKTIPGIGIGDSADRWTKDYTAGRDAAVKKGISPTRIVGNAVRLQNTITFFRPADIPTASNGYKSTRSIAILRNIMAKNREVFESEAWQSISIVADASNVTDFEAKQKVRDILAVETQLGELADFFEKKGWIYDAEFSKQNSTVAIRALSNGFDVNFKFRISGESQIFNLQQTFDTNISQAA